MIMIKFIFYLISIIFITSCASVTSPTGGPRDEIPPTLLTAYPPDQTLNFSTHTITLTFDEYI